MMVPSPVAGREIPDGLMGLGVDTPADFANVADKVQSQCLPADGCFPSWCNWMPFAEFFDACRVPTQAEMDAYAKTVIRKAATATTPVLFAPPGSSVVPSQAVGQTNEALANQTYALYQGDVAALCRLDPEGCAAFNQAGNSPNCSALLGTGSFGQTVCGNPGGYLALAGAGVLLLVVLMRR